MKKLLGEQELLNNNLDYELKKQSLEHETAIAEKINHYESKIKNLEDQNKRIKR